MVGRRRIIPSYLVTLVLLVAGACLAQQGDVERVHDPAIVADGSRFYVFSTGRGIPVRASDDLFTWKLAGHVFDAPPAWAARQYPRSRGQWAPDVHFVPSAVNPATARAGAADRPGGEFRLYYAVSTFGTRRSAIGLATSPTLDPSRPDYRWRDRGAVIHSDDADDFNAIDPNLVIDAAGRHWLVFGSFWSGIKARRLDPATGLLSADDTKLYALASRPDAGGAIEAPFVVRHDGFYYLFASFDLCCRGVRSTYNVRVGRSRSVTGPYVDVRGREMLAGGGTLVLCSAGHVRGPGHNAILQTGDGRGDFFVHHFYDADHNGRPAMQIRPLLWTEDGWPLVGEPITEPPAGETITGPLAEEPITGPLAGEAITRPPVHSDARRPTTAPTAGRWTVQIGLAEPVEVELLPGGRVRALDDDEEGATAAGNAGLLRGASWHIRAGSLELHWPTPGNNAAPPTARCLPTPGGYVGLDTAGRLVRVLRR
jgi:arabinan endo-1,5-alpha-L-arabinosidase